MIKYKTGHWKDLIQKIEVIKETDKCVYVFNPHRGKEGRENKVTSYYVIHDTFEQAKQYLIDKAKEKIKLYKDQLSRVEKELIEINKLKE